VVNCDNKGAAKSTISQINVIFDFWMHLFFQNEEAPRQKTKILWLISAFGFGIFAKTQKQAWISLQN